MPALQALDILIASYSRAFSPGYHMPGLQPCRNVAADAHERGAILTLISRINANEMGFNSLGLLALDGSTVRSSMFNGSMFGSTQPPDTRPQTWEPDSTADEP